MIVLRIPDIFLVRIQIRGSVPLTMDPDLVLDTDFHFASVGRDPDPSSVPLTYGSELLHWRRENRLTMKNLKHSSVLCRIDRCMIAPPPRYGISNYRILMSVIVPVHSTQRWRMCSRWRRRHLRERCGPTKRQPCRL